MFLNDLDLAELVNLEDWQKIQDLFADTHEITLRTFSDTGMLLSKVSRPNRLCSEIIPKSPNCPEFCNNCPSNLDRINQINISENNQFKCPLGFYTFSFPIKAVGERIAAYIVIGPLILKERKDISKYEEDARKLGIDVDTLMDTVVEISVFSFTKIKILISLIEEVFSYFAQTGYHKKRLSKIAPEILEMDPLFSRYYEKIVLSELLKTCTLVLGADSGSVMTLDEETKTLHMKASNKLGENIKTDADIKVGEGIAGYAVATNQPLILPKDKAKSDLSGKMKRKDIKSSMVIPFYKGNDHNIYGVINLNIIRKNKDFTEKDIEIAKGLINLASIALLPFKQPSESNN